MELILLLILLSVLLEPRPGNETLWNLHPYSRFWGKFTCWHKVEWMCDHETVKCKKCGAEYVTSLAEY